VNPTDDEFRRQAELCRLMAAKAATPELKSGWLQLAVEWESMITPEPLELEEDTITLNYGNGAPPGSTASR
jgi:hypothetical protein